LVLAFAAFAAAPALAQTPSSGIDWSAHIEGVDDTALRAPSIEAPVVVLDVTP